MPNGAAVQRRALDPGGGVVQLKPGLRLQSVVCGTNVVVVRGDTELDVRCGGAPMVPVSSEVGRSAAPDPRFAGGTQIGKRYADAELGVELLCTSAGEGSLSIGETSLSIKDAKPLPSSD